MKLVCNRISKRHRKIILIQQIFKTYCFNIYAYIFISAFINTSASYFNDSLHFRFYIELMNPSEAQVA